MPPGYSAARLPRIALAALMALALASLTPSPRTAQAGNFSKRIVGYFVQWGIYARDYEPADIPADKLTHVNYAFLAVDASTGKLVSIDSWADMQKIFAAKNGLPAQNFEQQAANTAGNFGRLRDLKALYPQLKVLLSVGGWSLSTPFPAVAADAAKRAAFAVSCAEWASTQGFDGIDIDWEYPEAADRDNFTALLTATRQALDAQAVTDGRTYLLTVASPAGDARVAVWDLPAVAAQVDWINIMTYDYHGGWDTITGHLAPLYENPSDPSATKATWNVNWAVAAYLDGGVPASKLHVGIPFYGRSWETVSSTDNGLFQSGQAGPNLNIAGNWENGVFDYWKVVELERAGSHVSFFDSISRVPFLYGPNLSSWLATGGLFITYESRDSLAEKLARVESLGLGGVMFWELSGDMHDVADSASLLGLMAETFAANPSPAGGAQPWLLLLLPPS